jgi:peptidyl-tRNA hydrolase, PTH1 family
MNLFKRKAPIGESSMGAYLIVGLGNPGSRYAATRHNVGFQVIDQVSKTFGITLGKVKSKAIIGEGKLDDKKVILAKPQTFMNLSGQAVAALTRFYKVPVENMVVIHDDLDLPLGTLRIRPGGGAGGQKGVQSIIEQLGTPDFARIRFGIGRPPGRMDPKDYVLENFLPKEQELAEFTILTARDAVISFIGAGLELTMNKYNGSVQPD